MNAIAILSILIGLATFAGVVVGAVSAIRDRDAATAILTVLGGLLGAMLTGVMWMASIEAAAPTFTLAKADWKCVESHLRTRSSTTIVNGRPMASVSTTRVCDAYRRIER